MTGQSRGMAGYWRLLGAATVSQFGTQVSALAVALIAVVVLRASAAQVGVVSACQPGAYLIAGIPGASRRPGSAGRPWPARSSRGRARHPR